MSVPSPSRDFVKAGSKCAGASGNEYVIDRPLGQGAVSVVYHANGLHGKEVAVKFFNPDKQLFGDDALLSVLSRRFVDEGALACRIKGRHLVNVIEAGNFQGVPFVIMDYFPSHSLAEKPLPSEAPLIQMLIICNQIAFGLQELHTLKCLHRDIKPANVLYNASHMLAKLTDFGAVKWADILRDSSSLTKSSERIGTFRYMSPEQKLNPRTADERSDIYSLGVTFYEMLTSQLPLPEAFASGDVVSVSKLHNCSGDIDVLLRRMTAYSAKNRPEDISDVIEELRLIIHSQSVLFALGRKSNGIPFSEFICEVCGSRLCQMIEFYSHHSGRIEIQLARCFCLECGFWNSKHDHEVEYDTGWPPKL